jgi:hypothetical protein
MAELVKRGLEKPYFSSTEDNEGEQLRRLQAAFNMESHRELDTNDDIKLPWIHESFAMRSWCTRKGDVLMEGQNNIGDPAFRKTVILPRTRVVENTGLFKCDILDKDTFYQGGINIVFEPTVIQKAHLHGKINGIRLTKGWFDIKYRWKDYRQRECIMEGRGDGNGYDKGWLDDRHSFLGASIDHTRGQVRRGGVGRPITYEDCERDNDIKWFRSEKWIQGFINNNDEEMDHVWTEEHVERGECPPEAVGESRTFIKVKVFRHVRRTDKLNDDAPPPLDLSIRFQFYNMTSHRSKDWCPFYQKYRRSLNDLRPSILRESKMHRLRIPGRGYQDMEWPRVFQDLKKVYILEIMYAKGLVSENDEIIQVPIWSVFTRPARRGAQWNKMSWETEEEMYEFLDKHITVKMVGLRPRTYDGVKFEPVWKNPADIGIDRDGIGIGWTNSERQVFDNLQLGADDVYDRDRYFPNHIAPNGMFNSVLLDEIGQYSLSEKDGQERNFNRALFTPGRTFLGGNYGRGVPVFTIAIEFSNTEILEVCVENIKQKNLLYEERHLRWDSTRDDRYRDWSESVSIPNRMPHIDTIIPTIGDVYTTTGEHFHVVTRVFYGSPRIGNHSFVESIRSVEPGAAVFNWELFQVETNRYNTRGIRLCSFVMRGIRLVRWEATEYECSYLQPGNFIQLAHDPRLKHCWETSYGAGRQANGEVRGMPAGWKDDWPVKVIEMRAPRRRCPWLWELTLQRQDPHLSHINNEFVLEISAADIDSGWWYVPSSKAFRENGTNTPPAPPSRDPRLDSSSSSSSSDDDNPLIGYQQTSTYISADERVPSGEDLMKRLKKLRF